MKTKKIKTIIFVLTALTIGLISFNVGANDKSGAQSGKQVIYQSQSINHNIYSYLNSVVGKISVNPQIIYVSQANGPAIHSYAHSVEEIAVPWNIEYVDTAYSPAIYSYGRPQNNGEVNVLPIVIN